MFLVQALSLAPSFSQFSGPLSKTCTSKTTGAGRKCLVVFVFKHNVHEDVMGIFPWTSAYCWLLIAQHPSYSLSGSSS